MSGPALPKETSGGGYKGSGTPTKSPKLPGEIAKGKTLKGKFGQPFKGIG